MGAIFLKQGNIMSEVKSIFIYTHGDKPVVTIQGSDGSSRDYLIESVPETVYFLENLSELLVSTDKPFVVIEYYKDDYRGFTIKSSK